MRTAIVTLVVAFIAGVSVLAVAYDYFGAKSQEHGAPAHTQAAPAPGDASGSRSPSASASKYAEPVQTRPQDQLAAEKRKEIRERELELAIDIAGSMSSVVARDFHYTKIVYQAILARDFVVADKAARKISSAVLRDEQLGKIVGACPSDAMTQEDQQTRGRTTFLQR